LKQRLPAVLDSIRYTIPVILDDAAVNIGPWCGYNVLAQNRGDFVIVKSNSKYSVQLKDRIKEGRKPKTIWSDSRYDASANGTILLKRMFNGEKLFNYPKSIFTVKDTVNLFTNSQENHIILDFFGGSGTTAHAVLDNNSADSGNRQFIVVEQLDYINSVTAKRVDLVIKSFDSGEFIYSELLTYNLAFINRILNCQNKSELVDIWGEIIQGSFLKWYIDTNNPDSAYMVFEEIGQQLDGLDKQKQLLFELLDKNQLYVNLSEIEDNRFSVSESDKALNRSFYGDAYGA